MRKVLLNPHLEEIAACQLEHELLDGVELPKWTLMVRLPIPGGTMAGIAQDGHSFKCLSDPAIDKFLLEPNPSIIVGKVVKLTGELLAQEYMRMFNESRLALFFVQEESDSVLVFNAQMGYPHILSRAGMNQYNTILDTATSNWNISTFKEK